MHIASQQRRDNKLVQKNKLFHCNLLGKFAISSKQELNNTGETLVISVQHNPPFVNKNREGFLLDQHIYLEN